MKDELSDMDATGQAQLIADGALTPLELVDATIKRIERLDATVHALDSRDFDAARERARTQRAEGSFGGVPLLVKDLLSVPGQPCRMGSRLFAGNVAQEGSPFTARLAAAGFNVLGKTTTSELGLLGSTEALLSGTTRNPWDLTRSATGSSGGSAAAVASGMVPLAHASDGGGSIRISAAACGLFGLKPSRGRCVPAGPDMHGLLIDFAVSRSVRDSARLLAVLEQQDGPLPPVGVVQGPNLQRLRIGVYHDTLMGESPVPAVHDALRKTVELCRALGHHVVDMASPPVSGAELSDTFFVLAGFTVDQLAAMMRPLLGRDVGEGELEPFTLELLAWFRALPAGRVPDALAVLAKAEVAMRQHLSAFDAVLCPTLPIEVPSLGYLSPQLPREVVLRRTESLAGYTCIHNMAGVPAMTVPLFRDPTGLPIGSHFAAPFGHEATLLALAFELEAAAPWIDSYPLPQA